MWIVDSDNFGHTTIDPKLVRTYWDKINKPKQWLAVIRGLNSKFGFDLEFVKKHQSDYRPNIMEVYFELQAGKIYRYGNFYIANGEYQSGYFAVNETQDKIITLEEVEVRRLFNMPVKNWEIQIEKTEVEKGKYADDDCPF